jgi:3-oxoacyl-[acyl-carrier protein] reductase
MDVTDSAEVKSVVAAAEKKYRRGFDVVINNAGIAKKTPIRNLTDAQWDITHETVLKGMMRVARATLPSMRKQKRGAIVCLSSVAGAVQGWADHVPYSAAKGGVAGFVRGLAVEVARDGVRVNGIAPGLIRTAQLLDPVHSVGKKGLKPAARAIPLGRIGEPEDIADVAVFLVSDKARYMTGHVVTVDGGLTISASF